MAKLNALQKIESHEKLCRIMQKLTHKKIHQIEERVKRLEKILLSLYRSIDCKYGLFNLHFGESTSNFK